MKEAGSYNWKAERQLRKSSGNYETEPGQKFKIEIIHLHSTWGQESVELEFKAGNICHQLYSLITTF
jgi:hypothetical protein